jgi:hypothetical protein
MQYKIPVQIENEDTIVLGLSIRQLVILMWWGGVAYGVFKNLEPSIGAQIAAIIAIPIAVVGVVVALVKVSEMTFLPIVLNTIRLSLNSKIRAWSQGTDSYSELDVGYVQVVEQEKAIGTSKWAFGNIATDTYSDKLGKI